MIFEIITKIKIINDFIYNIKSLSRFSLAIGIFTVISFSIAIYGLSRLNDNSIYIDTIEDNNIKEEMNNILKSCGKDHYLLLLTISTDTKYDLHAKLKEVRLCDKDCSNIVIADNRVNKDYVIDRATYDLLLKISRDEEVKVFHNSFEKEIENYETILKFIGMREEGKEDSILLKAGISKTPNIVWVTSVSVSKTSNNWTDIIPNFLRSDEQKAIYLISMGTWGNTPCEEGKMLLNKFKNKLPRTKLSF